MKLIMNVNYYTVNEIAEMFGLSVTTARNYFKSGKIPAKKIGNAWYATEPDIKYYLEQGKTTEVK